MLSRTEARYAILARGPWLPADIATSYHPPSGSPPEVILVAKQQREPALMAAAQRSPERLFDGGVYGLRKFSEHQDHAGRPHLSLDFTSSNYFDVLCVDNALDEPLAWRGKSTTLRSELFGQHRESAVLSPHLVNFFGFGGLIITNDNFAILSRRGSSTAVYPNHYTSSVDEGAAFPEDSADGGGVDLVHMVSRGVNEELALDIHGHDITFLSLGIDPQNNNCFLVALIATSLTKNQIQDHMRRHLAADDWERDSLYFIPWNHKSIINFMNSHSPWVSVTILEALRYSFE